MEEKGLKVFATKTLKNAFDHYYYYYFCCVQICIRNHMIMKTMEGFKMLMKISITIKYFLKCIASSRSTSFIMEKIFLTPSGLYVVDEMAKTIDSPFTASIPIPSLSKTIAKILTSGSMAVINPIHVLIQ